MIHQDSFILLLVEDAADAFLLSWIKRLVAPLANKLEILWTYAQESLVLRQEIGSSAREGLFCDGGNLLCLYRQLSQHQSGLSLAIERDLGPKAEALDGFPLDLLLLVP